MTTVDKEYCTVRMHGIEEKIDALALLMRRELELLAEDRNRQRADLSDRLEGMNALRAQLDRQAGTFATREHMETMRERVEAIERTSWRALTALAGIMVLLQIVATIVIKVIP